MLQNFKKYIYYQNSKIVQIRFILTEGEIKYVPFCLFGCPQGPQGCQKMRHYSLNLDLEFWYSNIEPKLNELQKISRNHQKQLIFGRISQFFSILAEYQSTNFQIQVQWIMAHLLTPLVSFGASKQWRNLSFYTQMSNISMVVPSSNFFHKF